MHDPMNVKFDQLSVTENYFYGRYAVYVSVGVHMPVTRQPWKTVTIYKTFLTWSTTCILHPEEISTF